MPIANNKNPGLHPAGWCALLFVLLAVLFARPARGDDQRAVEQNDAYLAAIAGLIASHNAAYPFSIVPGPAGGDPCAVQLFIPRTQADYSDLFGFITQFPGDSSLWGVLGPPQMYHANTDASLSVRSGGGVLGTGNQIFDIGTHPLVWDAETLISYPLDVALPLALMYLTSLKELPAGKEFILNVLLEAGVISAGEFLVNSWWIRSRTKSSRL